MGFDISIVIPTCKRVQKLKECIRSIENQDFPKERFEIIVIDDRSDKATEIMLQSFKGLNLKYKSQYRKGPASARNLGAIASTGRIIGFVDDDCVITKNWIKSMVDTHGLHPKISAVGGETVTATQGSAVLASQFLSNGSIETEFNGRKEIVFFPTCNVSIKREVFNDHCFDEYFPLPGGEDLEFFWGLFKEGHRFIWNREIKVVHYRDDTLSSFIKQAYCYGRGNLLVKKIHRDQPLLKELKTGVLTFWLATFLNIIKLPRFVFILGNKLCSSNSIKDIRKKSSIYAYFLLHKLLYILGNTVEFFRLSQDSILRTSGKSKVPNQLIIDITHNCNLTCKICDIWKTKTEEIDLKLEYVKKVLSEAVDLGIQSIALSGGEPLLRKDIFEILDHAKELGIKKLGLLSNGILVKEYFDRLKPYIISGVISPVISLDSLEARLHNSIRNSENAWQKTKDAIFALSLLKKEYPEVSFNVITIILNQNLEELLDLVKFVKSLQADSLQFQPLLSNNLRMAERKDALFWVSSEKLGILDAAIDHLIEYGQLNPGFIKNSPQNLRLIKKYYHGSLSVGEVNCFSGSKTILIANQGISTTCFSIYGDIRVQTLKEILQSRKIDHARRKVEKCAWPCLLPCFCDL